MEFEIDGTIIILRDLEKHGQGRIIISDDWRGAFNNTWGSMGSKITEFIKDINAGYFADKLCSKTYEFNGKATARNIRKYIREEMSGDLPWWVFMSAQKEMREHIGCIESCSNENEFIDICTDLPNRLMCYDLNYKEEEEFKGIITDMFQTEPWHFIGEKQTQEYKWLYDLHGKIKKYLSK